MKAKKRDENMSTRRPLIAALATMLTVPLGLAGCAGGQSDADISGMLESAIVTAVPNVTGAHVGLAFSGPSNRTVFVNLYLDTDDTSIVSAAVNSSLQTVWENIPIKPVTVGISATMGKKPSNARNFEPNAMDPAPIASALGIESKYVVDPIINIDAPGLEARYGTWQAPGS